MMRLADSLCCRLLHWKSLRPSVRDAIRQRFHLDAWGFEQSTQVSRCHLHVAFAPGNLIVILILVSDYALPRKMRSTSWRWLTNNTALRDRGKFSCFIQGNLRCAPVFRLGPTDRHSPTFPDLYLHEESRPRRRPREEHDPNLQGAQDLRNSPSLRFGNLATRQLGNLAIR